jgi:phage I-like protein
MPALQTLVEVPDSLSLSGGKATSEVQIAKTGIFKDPRYGTFAITLKDFSKWIANFNSLSKTDGREGIPVDVDHSPEKRGDTEAAGWITSIGVRGNELWAQVEWNTLGQDLVKDRRYVYLSPSYVQDYKDETGKSHGTTLIGVALTNRPFLTMATVSLSKSNFAEEVEDQEKPYTQEEMPELTKIAQAMGLSADSDEDAILAKAAELAKPPTTPVSLEDQAKSEGKFVLDANQFASLQQQASEGAAAATTLRKMTFESKFDKLLNDPKGARVLPAQKEMYAKLYESNAEGTIALLDSLPSIVNAEPVGSGSDAPANTLSASIKADAGEHSLDEDRNKLHERTVQLSLERKIDYGDALVIAADEMGIS